MIPISSLVSYLANPKISMYERNFAIEKSNAKSQNSLLIAYSHKPSPAKRFLELSISQNSLLIEWLTTMFISLLLLINILFPYLLDLL
jgi:hypothetical protein